MDAGNLFRVPQDSVTARWRANEHLRPPKICRATSYPPTLPPSPRGKLSLTTPSGTGGAPRDRSLVTGAAILSTGKTSQITGRQGARQWHIADRRAITRLEFYSGWPNAISAVTETKKVFSGAAWVELKGIFMPESVCRLKRPLEMPVDFDCACLKPHFDSHTNAFWIVRTISSSLGGC